MSDPVFNPNSGGPGKEGARTNGRERAMVMSVR